MEKIKVHPRENLYFVISLLSSVVVLGLFFKNILSMGTQELGIYFAFIFYGIGILLFLFVSHGLLIGYLKGNAVMITEKQFPEISKILREQSEKLQLSKVPTLYLIQSGGILNAFATRFFGRNFVVIYSEILELAYTEGKDAVEYIIGHELGHIARKHLIKRLLIIPSMVIPFLNSAYSRACEYTCDNIGKYLAPDGSVKGILILAAGKELYKHIDIQEYIKTFEQEKGFWKWFAQIVSTHPNLPKRIINLNN